MIRGFKIQGQYFEEETIIDLFFDEDPNKKGEKKYSVLYGKNGSGKTVISDAAYSYKTSDFSFSSVKAFDYEQNEIEIEKDNIFVFNENFTDKNITLSTNNDDINAIVLFGKVEILKTQLFSDKNNKDNH